MVKNRHGYEILKVLKIIFLFICAGTECDGEGTVFLQVLRETFR